MLKKCLVQCKWWVLSYILMGFIIQLLNQLGIVVFQNILDAAAADRTEATKFIIIYGMILGGSAILNYLDEYPGVYLSNSISENLKIMALKKIARIDYQAYQEIGTGQMIKVIENGAAAGNGILFSFFLRTLHELLPTLIFSLLFISFYNSGLMLLIAGGYAVIFVITNLLLRYLYTIKSTILKEQEKMSRYSIRGFMELVVFRTNGRYDKEIDKLSQTARTIINKNAQLKMIHEAFFAIFELFITIIKIFVIIFGVRSMIRGETTLGVVVALFMFIDKIYSPIAIFNILFVDYKLNQVTYRRLEDFIHAPEDKNLDSGIEVKQVQGHIEFRNVSFHYGSVRILNNLSFAIEPGKSVAFVGLSGSGKSTIVKLIAGLLKKSEGRIGLDGTEIDKLQLNRYYEHISYLSQDTPIFDTTIRGNIAFDNAMSDEEIYLLLEKVHLKDKIASLPEGLDALVGEKGVKLSGGERQRLAFARILAQKRNLIILDEAVSALDPITEKSIMETVFKEFRDKTVIIIAHRLECIKQFAFAKLKKILINNKKA
ncbi:ABC transporter ATP-binding protein [Paenibacillus sp. OAS669]|uniref:ABC transporter ATP-binding protein n=1 Tax=Paenibacillus sp. OAS669 TaxID=2663821 RepID=UPI00178B58C7|nr:ABC transporter ATP-binding protein [Paenibacillus sp. OAS669]MBE1445283.1 ATP-binding cassette subfamily B protein [Paenibacillus sp. OAS669]